MPRRIRVDGRVYEFPDDATDAEIAAAIDGQQRQQRAYDRRAAERAPRTDEQLRTGRGPNGGRDIPVPEFLMPLARGIQDFNRNGPAGLMSQMWRNVGIADEVAAGSEYLQSGGDADAARGAMQYERDERDRVAREQPNLNTASWVASVPALGGTGVPGRVTALQAGTGVAATNAPFALARQEGDLGERLPGAALETAAAFGLGTTLQGGANLLMRQGRSANSMGARAAQFDDAGVRPTLPAIAAPRPTTPGAPMVTADAGGAASLARAIAENPVAGIPARGHLRRSLEDSARAVDRIARGYGPRTGVAESGEAIQEGLRRWGGLERGAATPRPAQSIRNWSASQRANALYDDFDQRMAQAIRQNWTSRGQQAPILADETRIVLDDILGANSPGVSAEINDDVLRRFHNLVSARNPGGTSGAGLRWRDLRDLRSYVRRMRNADPSVRPTLPEAALARLEGALTSDIYATVAAAGGRNGQQLFRRLALTDRYYRRMNERLQGALRPFLRENVQPERVYRMVYGAAQEGGSRNIGRLTAVRQSLQPDEWRTFVATVIDEMGRARAGHPFANEGAFSISEFAANYARMSPEGRRALFGTLGSPTGRNPGGNFIDLERAMDNLAQVAGMQKAVERAANTSNSAVAAQAVGTGVGVLTQPQWTIPTLIGIAGMGEAMTNPAFIRWLTSASRAGATPGGMRRQLAALAQIAARDPAVAPVHAEIVRQVGRGGADSLGPEARPEAQRQPAQ